MRRSIIPSSSAARATGLVGALLAAVVPALAGAASLDALLSSQLQSRFPGARVELQDFAFASNAGEVNPSQAADVRLMGDDGRGTVNFTADGAQGTARFHAWMRAWIPSRRVAPLQKVSREDFASTEIDVATGRWRDLRGTILPADADLDHLESRQTLLEGEPVLSTAVTRTPDVRRGDPVNVRLISGDIILSTRATAVESAYQNGPVHVLTESTKRELVGKLLDGKVVEVTL